MNYNTIIGGNWQVSAFWGEIPLDVLQRGQLQDS